MIFKQVNITPIQTLTQCYDKLLAANHKCGHIYRVVPSVHAIYVNIHITVHIHLDLLSHYEPIT